MTGKYAQWGSEERLILTAITAKDALKRALALTNATHPERINTEAAISAAKSAIAMLNEIRDHQQEMKP
ncbi:hypothetical protein QP905_02565 [Corynebacterium pseudodiphtheriticum]|uniref:hypothetical protein n=1 Tax=Corynebacterium pseudodiphtheriticum TaxID=37637 RepID=UPI00254E78C5|nr:hypothetical protein [Corynebacterium pseudodiphtheriticum]MDK8577227.1 hypothetical protein [Corynebacterium pseudodiphtheriticum]